MILNVIWFLFSGPPWTTRGSRNSRKSWFQRPKGFYSVWRHWKWSVWLLFSFNHITCFQGRSWRRSARAQRTSWATRTSWTWSWWPPSMSRQRPSFVLIFLQDLLIYCPNRHQHFLTWRAQDWQTWRNSGYGCYLTSSTWKLLCDETLSVRYYPGCPRSSRPPRSSRTPGNPWDFSGTWTRRSNRFWTSWTTRTGWNSWSPCEYLY